MSAGQAPLFRADCELQQLTCVMAMLGTYSPEMWGGEHLLPDYGKIVLGESAPVPMAELFPDATPAARDLIASMLSCAPRSKLVTGTVCCIQCPAMNHLEGRGAIRMWVWPRIPRCTVCAAASCRSWVSAGMTQAPGQAHWMRCQRLTFLRSPSRRMTARCRSS